MLCIECDLPYSLPFFLQASRGHIKVRKVSDASRDTGVGPWLISCPFSPSFSLLFLQEETQGQR